VFDRVWSCLIKSEDHLTFDQKRKTFLLFACLMSDVLFVWTAAYQTCLMRACVPPLLSGLYQLFHLCLIKQVLTVWPLTSTLACLVSKQSLMVFGRQTFIVCPGPYTTTCKSQPTCVPEDCSVFSGRNTQAQTFQRFHTVSAVNGHL